MYLLRPHESSDQALKRIIVEEIDSIVALINDAEGDPDTAVHESRKSLKRIRAALRLVRVEIGETLFSRKNTVYRDLGRQIAPLRDSAIMIESLDLIRTNYQATLAADSFETVRQKLVEVKAETRQRFLQEADIFSGIVAVLAEARERVDTLPIHHHDFRAFEGGVIKVCIRGRLWMDRAYKDGRNPRYFHQWRKQVKYLWHQIEFFQPLQPPYFETLANDFHQLSDFLGEAHDAVVLATYIQENESDFAAEPALHLLQTLLHQRRQELETAARPLGERLYSEEPQAFADRLAAYWGDWQAG